ncbi:formimidoyltetrahydrofolate cyclodeaminase [Romboutsia weinsteinii]|uniref:Formimidoyltetrahydrofolate cyclodeaminase n=1 Tax=Romboutsia weinsteinii TaxID=2020949 RepID=A0A371JAB4_9FIRM|nr:cyclodeaminase/cyclohydrolase family protein [Romboutsia weinsteinii]RDY29597.1 formimidoyltetrahydrofolate cyclodeaminase [Romboutsia weinsteinii]
MKLIDMTVVEFANEVDSNSPAPGGGSVSALASNIGIGLARMMAHLSFGKKKYESLDESIRLEFVDRFNKLGDIREQLINLVDEDSESFNEFMKAIKMPKDTPEQIEARKLEMHNATLFSIEVPFKTAQLSLEALQLIPYLIGYGNQNAITDIGVGTLMLYTGLEGAILNVKVNLSGIEDKQICAVYSQKSKEILSKAKEIKDDILQNIHSKIDN